MEKVVIDLVEADGEEEERTSSPFVRTPSRKREKEEGEEKEEEPAKRRCLDLDGLNFVGTRWRPTLAELHEIQCRTVSHCNGANRHERDARIRFDGSLDEATGRNRHDYYIDGQLQTSPSVTGFIKKFFKPFPAQAMAERCSRSKTNPKYMGKTAADVLSMWEQTGRDGTAKHNAIEAFLQHETTPEDVLSERGTEAPLGFFRLMVRHPELRVRRTEWLLFDDATGLHGAMDVYFHDGVLGDWKNVGAGTIPQWGGPNGTYEREYGVHPLTRTMPDTKLSHYTLQLNIYRAILERNYGEKVRRMLLFNFPPEAPHTYEEYNIPFIDMEPFFALLPWDAYDRRHVLASDARDFLIEPVRIGDVRGDGPTKVERVRPGALPPNAVWVGRRYEGRGYTMAQSVWANRHARFGEPEDAAASKYEMELLASHDLLAQLASDLYGKTLLCWCDGSPGRGYCHANVLARYANALGSGQVVLKPSKIKTAFLTAAPATAPGLRRPPQHTANYRGKTNENNNNNKH